MIETLYQYHRLIVTKKKVELNNEYQKTDYRTNILVNIYEVFL
jgi:hypothetical protein